MADTSEVQSATPSFLEQGAAGTLDALTEGSSDIIGPQNTQAGAQAAQAIKSTFTLPAFKDIVLVFVGSIILVLSIARPLLSQAGPVK